MIETAVFGGSFNPVHEEHVQIARAAVRELGVKRLILLPTYNPPHKETADVSFVDRIEMLKIAFKSFPAEVIISQKEAEYDGKGYSSNILPLIREEYGDFYYVIGGDSLWAFEKWHEPEFIAKNFRIAVFNREGYPPVDEKVAELNKKWSARFLVMEYEGKAADSHTLRARLDLGLYDGGLPAGVYDYIKDNNLYGSFLSLIERVRPYLSENRFIHVKNTAFTGVSLNYACKLHQAYYKIMVAGILHDVGKMYDKDIEGARQFDIPADCIGTPVQHQFIGAELAKNQFGVRDTEVLDAIKFHTTGKPNMTTLEKLIFCADLVSTERTYSFVKPLRDKLYANFEKGFIDCINYSYTYLKAEKKAIYPLTEQAVNYYKELK